MTKSKLPVSRRVALGALGTIGGAAALVPGVLGGEGSGRADTAARSVPVEAGSRIGPWTITEAVTHHGTLALKLSLASSRDVSESELHLELLARDDDDPLRPPATTRHLALYVRNSGNGATTTREAHAKMARQIARLLEGSDEATARTLSTRRQREIDHPDELFAVG